MYTHIWEIHFNFPDISSSQYSSQCLLLADGRQSHPIEIRVVLKNSKQQTKRIIVLHQEEPYPHLIFTLVDFLSNSFIFLTPFIYVGGLIVNEMLAKKCTPRKKRKRSL